MQICSQLIPSGELLVLDQFCSDLMNRKRALWCSRLVVTTIRQQASLADEMKASACPLSRREITECQDGIKGKNNTLVPEGMFS